MVIMIVLLLSGRLIRAGRARPARTRVCDRRVASARPGSRAACAAFFGALEKGAKSALGVAVACALAGIIVGVVTKTGLGLKLASALVSLAGGNRLLTMFFTMLTSIILGMGVPTTANYIITSTIAAPALLQLGVIPIAAHLFVFYFGIIADLTPPVALAAYAGAAIARGNPFKTGVTATRLAIGAFILPYIFVMAPQLLLVKRRRSGMVLAVVTSLIGMTAISAGLTGFLVKKLHWVERILLVGAGLCLVDPRPRDGHHRHRRPGRHRRVPGSRAGEEGGGMKANRLSLKTKLGFGVCDMGGNLFVTIMGFYVLDFITDVALLGAALAGTVLFVGKIWDAVIDPAIGFFSDRTKSRHGRRRPWMLGGAIAVVFFMILMYTNPHIQSQGWLVGLGHRRVLPARHGVLGDQHPLRSAHPRADLGLRRADLAERLPDELRRDRDLHRRRGACSSSTCSPTRISAR